MSNSINTDPPFDSASLAQEIEILLLPQSIEKEQGIDGSWTFIAGDPEEVIVRICGDHLTICEYAMRWEDVASCVVRPKQIFTLEWSSLPRSQLTTLLSNMIQIVRELRISKFSKCEYCKETIPPDSQHDEKTCMGCAEKHLGVVH